MEELKDTAVKPKYDLLVAYYMFICPRCGMKVKKGSNYIVTDGVELCILCGLPARKLVPLNQKS